MNHTPVRSLQGKTLFITGASRGIGLAIGTRAARDGAQIVLVAKTVEPNPKLPGTLHSAAAQIEAAGGPGLVVPTDICLEAPIADGVRAAVGRLGRIDIRIEAAIADAVRAAIERFGGIDILINNASAISLTPTPTTTMKRFDLMFDVDVRGTFACTQACLAALIRSAEAGRNPHILNLSPPSGPDFSPGATIAPSAAEASR